MTLLHWERAVSWKQPLGVCQAWLADLVPLFIGHYSNMIGQPVKSMPQCSVFDSSALNDVPGRAPDGPQLQYGRQLFFVGSHG